MLDEFVSWFDVEYEHVSDFFDNIIAFVKTLLDYFGVRPVEIK